MSLFLKRSLALPTIAALSILTVSCGESKVSQCNRMVEVVNKAVTEVESTTSNAKEEDISTMTKIADTADRASESMKALEFTDEKLKGYQGRFLSMYTDIGKASRDLVAAVEKKDAAAAQTAYKSLETATNQESPLVDEMNGYCKGN